MTTVARFSSHRFKTHCPVLRTRATAHEGKDPDPESGRTAPATAPTVASGTEKESTDRENIESGQESAIGITTETGSVNTTKSARGTRSGSESASLDQGSDRKWKWNVRGRESMSGEWREIKKEKGQGTKAISPSNECLCVQNALSDLQFQILFW